MPTQQIQVDDTPQQVRFMPSTNALRKKAFRVKKTVGTMASPTMNGVQLLIRLPAPLLPCLMV